MTWVAALSGKHVGHAGGGCVHVAYGGRWREKEAEGKSTDRYLFPRSTEPLLALILYVLY
jgi:hypothetical protein